MNLHVFSSAVLVRLKVPLPGTSHHASKVLRGIPLHLPRECGGTSVVESRKVEVTGGSKKDKHERRRCGRLKCWLDDVSWSPGFSTLLMAKFLSFPLAYLPSQSSPFSSSIASEARHKLPRPNFYIAAAVIVIVIITSPLTSVQSQHVLPSFQDVQGEAFLSIARWGVMTSLLWKLWKFRNVMSACQCPGDIPNHILHLGVEHEWAALETEYHKVCCWRKIVEGSWSCGVLV